MGRMGLVGAVEVMNIRLQVCESEMQSASLFA